MASLKLSTKILCCIRKIEVKATPEEFVRQHVLNHLIDDLGYPAALISVEKELKSFDLNAPKRRLDILVFKQVGEGFDPFLLIECKAVPLTHLVENQALSYNHFVKAPFVACVNQNEVRLRFRGDGGWVFSNSFPLYNGDFA